MQIKIKDTLKCMSKNSFEELVQKPNSIQKLSIMLVPCDNLPWGPYEVGEECIADKNQQRAYLDQDSKNEFYTLFYHNQETFDA